MTPRIVSGLLAKLLLPTFTEMRDWKAKEAEKQKALTLAPAHARIVRTIERDDAGRIARIIEEKEEQE